MINVPFGGGRDSVFDVVEGRAAARLRGGVRLHELGPVLPEVHRFAPGRDLRDPGHAPVEHVNDNFGAAFGRLPDAALRRRQEEFFDSIS